MEHRAPAPQIHSNPLFVLGGGAAPTETTADSAPKYEEASPSWMGTGAAPVYGQAQPPLDQGGTAHHSPQFFSCCYARKEPIRSGLAKCSGELPLLTSAIALLFDLPLVWPGRRVII